MNWVRVALEKTGKINKMGRL